MIPVAVVLVVLVIVFTIAIIIGNPQSFDLQIFVARIPANITGVYVTGAVTMLVLAVAGWLLWTGLVRLRAQQKEIKALKAAAGVRGKALPGKSAGTTGTAAKDPKLTGTAEPKASGAKEPDSTEASGKHADSDPTDAAAPSKRDDSSRGSAFDLDEPSTGDDRPARGSADDAREPGGRTPSPKDRTDRGDRADGGETTADERRRMLDEAEELTRDDPRS